MNSKRIVRRFSVGFGMLVLGIGTTLRAQDLEPRAYSNSPTGLNFAHRRICLRKGQRAHRSVAAAR